MLAEGNPVRRPVGREDLADQVLPGNRPPDPRIAGLRSVVAHHEVVPFRDPLRVVRVEVAAALRDVRLDQLLPVDVDLAVPLLPQLPRQADDPLYERPGRRALLGGARRGVEDHDVAALGIAEVVDEAVREHPVREARQAAGAGPRTVETRLHRGRRDAVRVDDPRLDREHDRDRADDRDQPVEGHGPRVRQPEALDRVSHPRTLRSRLCSLRQSSIRLWSPDRSTSGTDQPRNSDGPVWCGSPIPPWGSGEKLSGPLECSLPRAPGSNRAIASISTIAGRSPFESTYDPIEIASVARVVTTRSANPSKRAERIGSRGSVASSSTNSCVSVRPAGVIAITRPS